MLDYRFNEEKNLRNLSKWVRGYAQRFIHFEAVEESLGAFYSHRLSVEALQREEKALEDVSGEKEVVSAYFSNDPTQASSSSLQEKETLYLSKVV